MKATGIIPARYDSSRFEGKVLENLQGKPLIWHVYNRAKQSKLLDEVIIATDNKKVKKIAEGFGAEVAMTDSDVATGTDRIAQVAESIHSDIIVNIQGDHPKILPSTINETVKILINDKTSVCSTAVTEINYALAKSKNIVKCLLSKNNKALYFSRSTIPFSKNKESIKYNYHIGIYAFKLDFLLKMDTLDNTYYQELEDLEQLKILEHGYNISVAKVNDMPIGVDILEDIKKVEKELCQ